MNWSEKPQPKPQFDVQVAQVGDVHIERHSTNDTPYLHTLKASITLKDHTFIQLYRSLLKSDEDLNKEIANLQSHFDKLRAALEG